jgi:hypothetical protein
MIKYFLSLILFLVSCSLANAQLTTTIQWQKSNTNNAGDTIFYDPYKKLTWDDFKDSPDRKSIAAAITESGFGYRLEMETRNSKTDIVITVLCFFNKMKSWVKPNTKSDYALLHEQHHFNITYIEACLFFQKLKASQFTVENCSSLLERINDECYRDLNKMQKEYDGQTKNGQLKNIQAAWNKKIDIQLAGISTD